MNVSRMIFCEHGVIEFQIESLIGRYTQFCQRSLYDPTNIVRWTAWSSKSRFSRFVIEPDGDRFSVGPRAQTKDTKELFDFRANKFGPTRQLTGSLILLRQLPNEGFDLQKLLYL